MLHYSTVYPNTLELLKKLMAIPELSDFYLAVGTALALQIGHRIKLVAIVVRGKKRNFTDVFFSVTRLRTQ